MSDKKPPTEHGFDRNDKSSSNDYTKTADSKNHRHAFDLSRRKVLKATTVGALLGVGGSSVFSGIAAAQSLTVTDLTEGLTAQDLAETLVAPGSGIGIQNVTYTGADEAAGTFSGGSGIIGVEDGIILSSGRADDVVGPNEAGATTTNFDNSGDSDLTALSGEDTFDASILEFDFTVPEGAAQVDFNYVFGSEEYNEFVGTQFDDVFAFFINGENCATVNGDRVSVNSINNGSHSDLFIDNTDGSVDTEMDGFTTVLTCTADVNPGETNTMRMAIADSGDHVLDAWVMIESGSLAIVCLPESTRLLADQDVDVGSVTVSQEEPGSPLNVTYTTTDDWYMTETHLHIAEDCADIPQNRNNNPMVGQFDFSDTHDPAVQEHTVEVPLDEAWESGDILCIAAHADVQKIVDSEVVKEESAWGEGERFTERGNWAMHFEYEVCD